MEKQLEKEIKRLKNRNKINKKRIKFLRLAIKAEKLTKISI